MAKLSSKKLEKMKKSADEVKASAEQAVSAAQENVAEAVSAAKETAEAVAANTGEVVKATQRAVKKAADTAKDTAKKAEKAVEAAKSQVFVQTQGHEANVDELLSAAMADFKETHKRAKINDFKLYINADERKAYYVANGDPDLNGSVDF